MELSRSYDSKEIGFRIKAGINGYHLYNTLVNDRDLVIHFSNELHKSEIYIEQYEEVLLLFRFSFNIQELENRKATTFRLRKLIKIHDFIIQRYIETNSLAYERMHKLVDKQISLM